MELSRLDRIEKISNNELLIKADKTLLGSLLIYSSIAALTLAIGFACGLHKEIQKHLIILPIIIGALVLIVSITTITSRGMRDVYINRRDKTISLNGGYLQVDEKIYLLEKIEGIYIKRGDRGRSSTFRFELAYSW